MSWNVIVYKNQLKKKKKKKPRNSKEYVMQSFTVFCSFVNNGAFVFGSGAWKFNNSVLYNTGFVQKFILKL